MLLGLLRDAGVPHKVVAHSGGSSRATAAGRDVPVAAPAAARTDTNWCRRSAAPPDGPIRLMRCGTRKVASRPAAGRQLQADAVRMRHHQQGPSCAARPAEVKACTARRSRGVRSAAASDAEPRLRRLGQRKLSRRRSGGAGRTADDARRIRATRCVDSHFVHPLRACASAGSCAVSDRFALTPVTSVGMPHAVAYGPRTRAFRACDADARLGRIGAMATAPRRAYSEDRRLAAVFPAGSRFHRSDRTDGSTGRRADQAPDVVSLLRSVPLARSDQRPPRPAACRQRPAVPQFGHRCQRRSAT